MALAGRAAVRMQEAAGRPASTIAAFLRRAEAKEVVLGPESMLVIDEASMLDLPTFYRILRQVPSEARILLVGDPGQLPPIGFGLVLHALVDDPRIPKVELVRVYRQTDATGIPAVGRALRAGTLPSLPAEVAGAGSGVVMIPRPGGVRTEDVVDVVADLGGFAQDLRVLSATKAGPAGIEALNARFHAIMAAGRPEAKGFAEGEPVMFLKNDYRRDLRNGSLGVVKAVGEGAIVCDFDGAEHEFAGAGLDDLTLAYAITIHKAQGSQFRTVVVPVAQSRLLDRSLVYTAVTRAVDLAVLIGPVAVLSKAVAREQAADRREVALGLH
jgi:exodeoxyribonuclease V alpha subunit